MKDTAFYGLYLAAGFTDMLDGTISRKLGSESEFGAKLDLDMDGSNCCYKGDEYCFGNKMYESIYRKW